MSKKFFVVTAVRSTMLVETLKIGLNADSAEEAQDLACSEVEDGLHDNNHWTHVDSTFEVEPGSVDEIVGEQPEK
jgi:hypothetical protein